ncbi:hypothetical protein H1C71_032991 [Ictidomys tridecemlineatus]|nr:hypothetical protein H1C71_032991 [Ictidomys tridecemlineatus]
MPSWRQLCFVVGSTSWAPKLALPGVDSGSQTPFSFCMLYGHGFGLHSPKPHRGLIRSPLEARAGCGFGPFLGGEVCFGASGAGGNVPVPRSLLGATEPCTSSEDRDA